MDALRDISEFAKEVGFRYRTFVDPVLLDVFHAIFGEDGVDPDPLRHLVIPLRMIAGRHADSTAVKFSIHPSVQGHGYDRIPVVASFRSDDEGGEDYFVIAIDDTQLKPRRHHT